MILQSFYLFCSEVCVPLGIHPIKVFQKFRENEEISLAPLCGLNYPSNIPISRLISSTYILTQRLDKSYNYLPTYQKCFYGTIFLLFCVMAKILLIISRRQVKKNSLPISSGTCPAILAEFGGFCRLLPGPDPPRLFAWNSASPVFSVDPAPSPFRCLRRFGLCGWFSIKLCSELV